MDVTHPIFRGPLPVTLTTRDVPVPEHYRSYPEGRDLAAVMPGWRVCREPVGGYWGVVADGYGFDDSPDCEYIAGGVNSKGPRSAALARQGNLFQWGFSAAPDAMTDEAQVVFLNVLDYMRRFDGCRPLVSKQGRAREWMRVVARHVGKADMDEYAKRQLPPEIYAGGDAAAAGRLAAELLPFLRQSDKRFAVDAECRALGIGNRDPALLTTCVAMLAAGDGGDTPRTLLERYTGQQFATAAEWQRWLASVQDRLYCSDAAGGRWLVRPADYPAPHRAPKVAAGDDTKRGS